MTSSWRAKSEGGGEDGVVLGVFLIDFGELRVQDVVEVGLDEQIVDLAQDLANSTQY